MIILHLEMSVFGIIWPKKILFYLCLNAVSLNIGFLKQVVKFSMGLEVDSTCSQQLEIMCTVTAQFTLDLCV